MLLNKRSINFINFIHHTYFIMYLRITTRIIINIPYYYYKIIVTAI